MAEYGEVGVVGGDGGRRPELGARRRGRREARAGGARERAAGAGHGLAGLGRRDDVGTGQGECQPDTWRQTSRADTSVGGKNVRRVRGERGLGFCARISGVIYL